MKRKVPTLASLVSALALSVTAVAPVRAAFALSLLIFAAVRRIAVVRPWFGLNKLTVRKQSY